MKTNWKDLLRGREIEYTNYTRTEPTRIPPHIYETRHDAPADLDPSANINSESKKEKKDIYSLELHESVYIKSGEYCSCVGYIVTRVPGGWLYKCGDAVTFVAWKLPTKAKNLLEKTGLKLKEECDDELTLSKNEE
jgi:hypothetical protein